MPLIKTISTAGGLIGIWRITEDESELRHKAGQSLCADVAGRMAPSRLLEKLAVRAMLPEIAAQVSPSAAIGKISYNTDGAPSIGQGLRISISHTDGYAAIYLSDRTDVAVDIEVRSGRAFKLAARFNLYPEVCPDADSATICWSAKETLFKLVGQSASDFRESVFVKPFSVREAGTLTLENRLADSSAEYIIFYELFEDFVLTHSARLQ